MTKTGPELMVLGSDMDLLIMFLVKTGLVVSSGRTVRKRLTA
jgi:hypothetical protein